MSEHEAPFVADAYEEDPRPRDFYYETEDGIKPTNELTGSQRAQEIAKLKQTWQESKTSLEEIVDSTNSTAPVYQHSHALKEAEARLAAFGITDPEAPSPEDIAAARHAAGRDTATEDETVDPADDPRNLDPHK